MCTYRNRSDMSSCILAIPDGLCKDLKFRPQLVLYKKRREWNERKNKINCITKSHV